MAKAQPKNPRTAPAATDDAGATTTAQAQGQQQDNTAQGTNNEDAAAAGTATEGAAQAQADTQADDNTAAATADVLVVGAGPAAGASAALAAVAEALATAERTETAAPEGPARDEQGRLEYEVVSPLNNGKRHDIGARVWLSDEDAGPLLGHTVKPYTPAAADEDEGAAHA
jgi:hypothetical protein